MTIEIVPYAREHEAAWDQFCADAGNATFLHTRRFLNYHGDRFQDLSMLIVESGKVVGVFPAAGSLTDPGLLVSHPGITYGGIVHQGWLAGMRMVEALTALCKHYGRSGYQRLLYKVVPYIYAKMPAQDDLYALFRLGAQRVRCDLSCTIDLANRQLPSERRRRGLKKAQKMVALSREPALLNELWEVIAYNLARKHEARPVHSLEELSMLLDRFPEQITICCALLEDRVEAGVVLFNSVNVCHAQYIAARERGYEVSALDAVFESAIESARQASARYFDFGISNEDNGWILNEGLYRFKAEFGGGGVVHEFYELELHK
jgi:Acetyltransferase (GNAT) domain